MEKVIDITERVPAMKKRRKRRTNFKFVALITVFLLIILVLLYFQLPYSNIKKIDIKGAELREEAFYLQQSTLQIDDSLWGFKTSEVEQTIAENEWIKSVHVKRKFLNDVEITIDEWHKVAYISKDGEFYPMLENGVIFNEVNEITPIDAPIFLDFEDEALRKKLLTQLVKLKPEVLSLISQINSNSTEADPYAITLFMNDGYEVRADANTLGEKLNYYPSIIAQIEQQEGFEKGIIDIEVGSYYRPFSDEYSLIGDVKAESEEGGQEENQNDEQQEQQTGEE
ncbi:FtsQ-type POTRA domain-containing protein [Solibacillus sp. MA9]|uniref:Cell division protein DivIB n=1 Tax=Solibacillus palustris TaxID=2908203 RepID=A0ABS9U915_9BACL|nr:FtsQ-type POTRA domain-containing protein [Solibacillus sp. MA9]MCH7320839.1 FtsQ-type POTRA domain-containing protein [Solibacillus sp. MA9]